MRWRETVSRGSRLESDRNDSGTSEALELKSCSRDTTFALRSIKEAIEETSPTMDVTSVMDAISFFTRPLQITHAAALLRPSNLTEKSN
jgi:hypothetical protein